MVNPEPGRTTVLRLNAAGYRARALSGPARISSGSVASQISSIRIIPVDPAAMRHTDGPARQATPPQPHHRRGESRCGWCYADLRLMGCSVQRLPLAERPTQTPIFSALVELH